MSDFSAPLRCTNCGTIVHQKVGSKTPKYCPPCRHAIQDNFRQQAKKKKTFRSN